MYKVSFYLPELRIVNFFFLRRGVINSVTRIVTLKFIVLSILNFFFYPMTLQVQKNGKRAAGALFLCNR